MLKLYALPVQFDYVGLEFATFCSNSSFYIKSVLPVTTSEVGFMCGRFSCMEKRKVFSNILLGDKQMGKDGHNVT
jgi:hypothetical protein